MKPDIDFDAIQSSSVDDIVAVEFNDGYIDTEMPFFEETINLRELPGEGEVSLTTDHIIRVSFLLFSPRIPEIGEWLSIPVIRPVHTLTNQSSWRRRRARTLVTQSKR